MHARIAGLLAVISLSLPQVNAANFTFSYGNASQCESFNISWSGESWLRSAVRVLTCGVGARRGDGTIPTHHCTREHNLRGRVVELGS